MLHGGLVPGRRSVARRPRPGAASPCWSSRSRGGVVRHSGPCSRLYRLTVVAEDGGRPRSLSTKSTLTIVVNRTIPFVPPTSPGSVASSPLGLTGNSAVVVIGGLGGAGPGPRCRRTPPWDRELQSVYHLTSPGSVASSPLGLTSNSAVVVLGGLGGAAFLLVVCRLQKNYDNAAKCP